MSVIKNLTIEDLVSNPEKVTAGEKILLSGCIYTARDAAHKKLTELINEKKPLPIALKNSAIYYAGPTEAPENKICGSIGPTTSSRMDGFSPLLMENGLKIMIGKGPRSLEVVNSIKKHKGLYLLAIGGAGAIYSSCVKSLEIVAFPELGTESIKKLTIKDFPLFVGIDSNGNKI